MDDIGGWRIAAAERWVRLSNDEGFEAWFRADNVCGAGQKLVLDGLVAAGILPGDGWAHVRGLEHAFVVDADRPGVLVEIEACEP